MTLGGNLVDACLTVESDASALAVDMMIELYEYWLGMQASLVMVLELCSVLVLSNSLGVNEPFNFLALELGFVPGLDDDTTCSNQWCLAIMLQVPSSSQSFCMTSSSTSSMGLSASGL